MVKAGQEQAFHELATTVLIPEARKLQGCQLFSLFQNTDNPREFILHEQWQTHEDVAAYKQKLIDLLGQPHPGEEFPAKMNDLIAEDEDLL